MDNQFINYLNMINDLQTTLVLNIILNFVLKSDFKSLILVIKLVSLSINWGTKKEISKVIIDRIQLYTVYL